MNPSTLHPKNPFVLSLSKHAPFDKLRANGSQFCTRENPFVLSLSKHVTANFVMRLRANGSQLGQ